MQVDPSSAVDERACPKCGTEWRDGATACASCGLAVARMAAYREARDAAVPEPVHAAWARLADRWDEAALHDELLRLVVTNHCFAWAAGRYRTRKGDPVAQRQLDRLRRAAEVSLLATATVRPEASVKLYRGAVGVLAVLVVMIVVGVLYATVLRDKLAANRPAGDLLPRPGSSVSR